MQVRIGEIEDCDMINGGQKNIAHTIFFAGCDKRCVGCHNESLQPMDSGHDIPLCKILNDISANELATCVVLTGGEPLLQLDKAIFIAIHSWLLGKEVWLYTSRELGDISEGILDFCDVVKTGWYDESKKSSDGVLATSNQHYYRKEDNGVWKLV